MMRKEMEEAATAHPFYKKRAFWIAMVAILLVAAIIIGIVAYARSFAPAVYDFEGATLREDAFAYWFSCLKYVYQVRYKSLKIADTETGWAEMGADGKSYGDSFREMITEEILLRFIAASLFDANGYVLSDADYSEINTLLEELDSESFGEVPMDVLKSEYGVSRRTVKQTALYEQKYAALYRVLFSDAGVIYGSAYAERLAEFYNKYYSRYNMIYVEDSLGSEKIEALEAELWPNGNVGTAAVTGITEERFTQLEASYASGNGVTSGNYPNGIYLYAGESYTSAFSEELYSAFLAADEVGKVVKVRAASGTGSYYVMRYALDDAPYLSEDTKVKTAFEKLPEYAGAYLYRALLRDELAKIVSHGVAETYTMAGTKSCRDYNIVNLLGN